MKDMQGIIRQAQQMQERLARLQEELAGRTVEASSGGGMVTVVVNGRQEVVSIRIEKEVVSPEDVELLQDLVAGAVNEAISRSRKMMAEEMAKITGGRNRPGALGSRAWARRRRRALPSTCSRRRERPCGKWANRFLRSQTPSYIVRAVSISRI